MCAKRVREALESLESVSTVKVDLESKLVTITTSDANSKLERAEVEKALSKYKEYTVAAFKELPQE